MFNSLQSCFSWVQGRNCHFLDVGDSLPGGGDQPARNPVWVCALSIVPSSHWIWLKALSCSCWRGVTLVVLCLWSTGLQVTPWRCWAQAASSLAVSLGEAVFFWDQLFQASLSSTPGLIFVETGLSTYFHLCTLCFRAGAIWGLRRALLGQTARPCGWTSRLTILVHRALLPWVVSSILTHCFFTRFALFPAPESCSCTAWHWISQLSLSTCIVQSWLFVAANDLLQRVLWKVKHYSVVFFFILAWKTAELFITCCKLFIALEMLVARKYVLQTTI